jgi:uncharacterized repeat protein (TIGR01451 family)
VEKAVVVAFRIRWKPSKKIMSVKCFFKWPACRSVAAISVLLLSAPLVRAVNLVQDFYLPMPEQQIYQANSAIVGGTSSTINSTFSIVVTGSGTVIYYDQWEDGYETDLSHPTQATTQIWGDGNDANGIPPGFAHDPVGLPAGTVITLTNAVTQPRNPSTLLWDARDHIAATKALVISRAAWPVNPGPVFAGAVGVLSTLDYGTNYISPVGQDLTNNLFKYVGIFLMAAQNNTAVTIDPNGNGVGVTNIVLNQGESYLVNGGVKKGGRVTASKPVQADLVIGHVGASYASDWFTLYPVEEWDNTYYTPVGSSVNGNPAYVYLFNPNTNAITINYKTSSGSGSVSVPASNGVVQFQTPVSSGASFASASGQSFFAICTVAANNASDTSFNWGFTLVPKDALTTEADVGWGPGSADGTVDGSPVWVTALANTKLYVDYKGDHLGPLTDPNGNQYDTNFTVTTLQSQKIYDPSKNQTGMRIYTLDGTLITAAWGEDPDVASPGNPYIDAGTTVLPFPVPILTKTSIIATDVPPAGLSIGDTIQYTVQVDNRGLLPLGNTVVVDAPSTNMQYVTNSTTFNGTPIPDSLTGTPYPLDPPGYTIPVILRGGTSTFQYLYRVTGPGVISNSFAITASSVTAQTTTTPAPTNGASVTLNFSDTNGVPVSLYAAGANLFVTMTNAVGNTSSNSAQIISVTVVNLTHGDLQTITLTETGTNTGVFRNIAGLPTSTSSGLGQQDGTLNVTPGDALSVTYTDPVFGDSASNSAAILIPALTKQLYLSVNGSTNGVQDLNRVDPVAFVHSPTRTSKDIGSGGGVIALDSVTTVSNTTSLTATFSHTTSSGANRLMLVGVSLNRLTGGSTFEIPTNITYAGVPLTLVGGRTNLTTQEAVMWIFALTNPASGANNVVVSWNEGQTDGDVIGCATFTGVNQATPYGAFFSNVGTSTATLTNVNVVVTSAPGELVFDTVALRSQNFGAVGSPGANQTALWKTYFNSKVASGASTQPGAASVTNSWTTSGNNDWVIGAVSIKPAASAGSTNVTVFTQTPGFCSNFVMPSNNFVIITNYITVTNGVLPANPAVTATLQCNGTNLIALSNPTYNSAAGYLVWSGVLTSNLTVPAGQVISYVISNGQAGVVFHVNYDSTNAPSKIILPASTVINVNTLGVYDAPYPGGNLVTAPVAGSTVYVRANVSDPFGSYDITSLGLAITAPSPSANVNVVLNDANAVANDGCSKTYEYAWQTGPTTGGYNLAATANEGTEGVTSTAAASVSLIFLDLGTPSKTEFTSGNNGVATNGFPANSSTCIRVTDLNRNTNSATVDTVLVTVTSSAGDSEVVALTETGTNTGIFTSCLTTSTNSGAGVNNGLLLAPVGSVLTVSYSDPTDPSDNTSATATILPSPGVSGVVMNKTILSPSGGQVGTGQPVTYNLQVVNNGSTVLTNVIVTDNFPSNALAYSTASLSPSTVATTGLVTWTNIGTMTPGQSTNITVTFITLATGIATNFATANGGTAVNSSSVTLLVTHSALNVTKFLLSPTNTPVAIGSNVVFRITIQNTGNTVIPTLPLEDTFSGAYYQFVSATIPPNGSGAGTLIWTNLASPVALATNAIITNDITMQVVGQGNPANNTATADYALDIFGNPVPTASGAVGVVTAAAAINGHVYNDINHNGVFTNGDSGLNDVTLQLFTDPNGDGNPADGALVQIVNSDANGYYEFVNLNLGHYVIVETALPGYSSSVPSSGRLAFNLVSLAASTNNNFFQYQPSPTLYSTITGTVWNDVNGNGTNDAGETGLAGVEVDLVQDINTNRLADVGEPVVNSVNTDTNGNYSFAGVTPGSYVILQTDPYGYYTTADSQPPNDNQIGVTVANGNASTNNNFYDHLNHPPVASNDVAAASENIPVTLAPLLNDSDPDGNSITLTNVTTTNGLAIILNATNVLFTPATNFVGTVTLNYTIADSYGATASAIITVTVTNRPPVANPDSYAIPENTIGAFTPLANDVVVTPGGTLAIISVSPTNGTATILGGTNVQFVPATNFIGTATIGYAVTDGIGGTNSTLITVAVTNRPPVANPDSYSVAENTTNSFAPLVNDVLVTTGGKLAIVSVTPTNGTATILGGTNVQFVPATNFIGTATIGYAITDSIGGTNSTLITIAVTNRPPVANPDNYGMAENTTNVFRPLTNDVLVSSGGSLSIISVSPTNGTATILGGTNVQFAPATNFLGTATIGYTITDGIGGTNGSLISITVTNVPLARADIAVLKTGPTNGVAGSNLTYTVTVTNLGPASATNILVTDQLPAGFTFVSASPAATVFNNAASWTVGSLALNARTNFTVTAVSAEGGNFTNVAFAVTSGTVDPNPTNNDGTLTNSQARTTVTPLADVAVFKTGGTNISAGGAVVYTITATNAGPSTASNVVVKDSLPAGTTFQSASGAYTLTNSAVTWQGVTLTNGASVNFTLTLTAPASGSFTNIASSTSSTPDANTNNNNGSAGGSKVRTTVTSAADVQVSLAGPTNVIFGSNFTFVVTITNAGPGTASNVVVQDLLETGLIFSSASAGGTNAGSIVTWPTIKTLPVGASTNVTMTVTTTNLGVFTNVATATASTPDPNPANNNGTLPMAQAQTLVETAQFGLSAGTNVVAVGANTYRVGANAFNPQTGLYEESVTVTNTGSNTVAGVRLLVSGLRSGVSLYNATGTNTGTPYVESDFPLNPTNTVVFALEFYNPSRLPFTNTLTAVGILPPNSGSTGTNGSVAINTIFVDTRIAGDTRYVIEFNTIPGKTYTIIYSDDLLTWKVATPSITANANVTQWYDDGPPKTDNKPASLISRYYRVIQN